MAITWEDLGNMFRLHYDSPQENLDSASTYTVTMYFIRLEALYSSFASQEDSQATWHDEST